MKRSRRMLVLAIGAVLAAVVLVAPESFSDEPENMGFIGNLWATIRDALIAGMVAVRDLIVQAATPLVEQVLELVPDVWLEAGGAEAIWATVGPILATADYWFPITEMLVVLGIYYAFLSVMTFVKWVLKAAPFVGG